jgi:hypothetical protein
MPFSLGLINKLESDLSKFIEWGKSKGIKFEGSRVPKYIELLGAYRDALQRNEIDDLMQSRGAVYLDQIPHEIAELVYELGCALLQANLLDLLPRDFPKWAEAEVSGLAEIGKRGWGTRFYQESARAKTENGTFFRIPGIVIDIDIRIRRGL